MNPTIGQAIKDRVESIGMSKAELARRLMMSSANVHKIFKRSSIDIEMLHKIGVALRYDFISHYQYLTVNAISGSMLISTVGYDPRVKYTYSLRKKITQVLESTQELSVEDAAKPVSQFVAEIDFIQDMLSDIRTRILSDN
jgi:transcriptional regulator with XRE-family HTH domain